MFGGAAYGFRRSVVEDLRSHGITVRAVGMGWDEGFLGDEALVEAFNTAHVLLGMGGIGYCEQLTTLKSRDFDGPCTGGAPYLTTFNPDLADHFRIGEEILCYGTRDDLVELVRRCIRDRRWAAAIARAGRERCLRQHTWRHRFEKVLSVLGVLKAGQDARAASPGSLTTGGREADLDGC